MSEHRKPGRPRLEDKSGSPSTAVCVRLPAPVYDNVFRLAREHRETVSDTIRRMIAERGGKA